MPQFKNKKQMYMKQQKRYNEDLLLVITQRIKQLRTENNVTQETFYLDTGIHIARIETGRLNVTISTLQAICEYFDVNLPTFFKGIK
jgi:transcriptional regulator with XRE-family HTH domain